nr:Formylmethionine deformylase [Medicago truncatula]
MEAARRLASRLRVVPMMLVFSNATVSSSSSSCNTETPPSNTKLSSFSSASSETAFLSKTLKSELPHIVQAGDPVLHEPAREVDHSEINSDKIQKIIDGMILVMRNAPGISLSAQKIGIPLRIIVLEEPKENLYNYTEEVNKIIDRRPFDLLVILNPKLKIKSNKTFLFFEGCLSVHGFQAVVERYLDVEVEGFDRYGEPIKINASGWHARILQHECDHLDGTLYVDKMVPRTFRSWENINMSIARAVGVSNLAAELKTGAAFDSKY